MSTTIEAGNLNSDHIGRKVSVTWKQDLITSTVNDALVRFTNRGALVTLFFDRTSFRNPSILGTSLDQGLTVNSQDIVTIEEVAA